MQTEQNSSDTIFFAFGEWRNYNAHETDAFITSLVESPALDCIEIRPVLKQLWLIWVKRSYLVSNNLNEGLLIEWPEKFSKNDFSVVKVVGSALELSAKKRFTLDKYRLKTVGLKLCFCYLTFRETEKKHFEPPPPS